MSLILIPICGERGMIDSKNMHVWLDFFFGRSSRYWSLSLTGPLQTLPDTRSGLSPRLWLRVLFQLEISLALRLSRQRTRQSMFTWYSVFEKKKNIDANIGIAFILQRLRFLLPRPVQHYLRSCWGSTIATRTAWRRSVRRSWTSRLMTLFLRNSNGETVSSIPLYYMYSPVF